MPVRTVTYAIMKSYALQSPSMRQVFKTLPLIKILVTPELSSLAMGTDSTLSALHGDVLTY